MSERVSEILHELADAIEVTFTRLSAAPVSAPASSPPDVSAREMLAVAQDIRETANAARQSTPTRFWIDGLFARARAIGHPDLHRVLGLAEDRLDARRDGPPTP